MAAIHLRPFAAQDADALAALWHASWLTTGVPAAASTSVDDLRARVHAEVASGWHVTVAEAQGTLAGFLALRLADKLLDQLFVAPRWKRHGVGTRLFERAVALMPNGFSLRTAAANTEARSFYEQRRMTLAHAEMHPVHGHEVAIYVMDKRTG